MRIARRTRSRILPDLFDGTLVAPSGDVLLRTAKSASVGAAATALDLVLLFLLIDVAGLDPRAANIPALFGGLLFQFAGNKLFAYEDRSRDWARQGLRFGVVELAALLLNALLFDLLIAHFELSYPFARAIGTALVYFGFSLPLWSQIFHRGPS